MQSALEKLFDQIRLYKFCFYFYTDSFLDQISFKNLHSHDEKKKKVIPFRTQLNSPFGEEASAIKPRDFERGETE